MKLRITLLVLLVILTLTAAQFSLAAAPTQENAISASAGAASPATTPTPTPGTSNGGNVAEHDHDLPPVEDSIGPAITMSDSGQVFQVTIAVYLMDTAGFHSLDERLNQAGTIEAGDAGMVNRVNRVLAATQWPADLEAQADELQATLSQYAEALANDDLEAAKPLATQTHEQQHALSHAAESWLDGVNGKTEHGTEDEHDHAGEHEAEHGG